MEPEDREEAVDVCCACGAVLPGGAEGVFAFGTENVLCAACATARGGRYDAVRDLWEVAPDLTGLSDEAYGAAPHEVRKRRV
jgi:hypothetical protein